MEARAKLLGHPIHQMLIVFPMGLLATAAIFDVAYLITKNGLWPMISFYLIAVGIAGGILAAPFGWWDWMGIPDGTRAKRVGLLHGFGNVIVLTLFLVSLLERRPNTAQPQGYMLALSFVGVAIAFVTGWLGGELVDRLGVGVDSNAGLNAPSSLTKSTTGSPTR